MKKYLFFLCILGVIIFILNISVAKIPADFNSDNIVSDTDVTLFKTYYNDKADTFDIDEEDFAADTSVNAEDAFVLGFHYGRGETNSILSYLNTSDKSLNTDDTNIFYIKLIDEDENEYIKSKDTVSIKIVNATQNETETIILTETENLSGIFTGYILIDTNIIYKADDDTLYVQTNDIGYVYYEDADVSSDTEFDTFLITGPLNTDGIFTLPDPSDFNYINYTVNIYLNDLDQNINGIAKDTLLVTAKNLTTGDSIYIELNDQLSQGEFSAEFIKTADINDSGADTLYVQAGDSILFEYTDPNDDTDTDKVEILILAPKLPSYVSALRAVTANTNAIVYNLAPTPGTYEEILVYVDLIDSLGVIRNKDALNDLQKVGLYNVPLDIEYPSGDKTGLKLNRYSTDTAVEDALGFKIGFSSSQAKAEGDNLSCSFTTTGFYDTAASNAVKFVFKTNEEFTGKVYREFDFQGFLADGDRGITSKIRIFEPGTNIEVKRALSNTTLKGDPPSDNIQSANRLRNEEYDVQIEPFFSVDWPNLLDPYIINYLEPVKFSSQTPSGIITKDYGTTTQSGRAYVTGTMTDTDGQEMPAMAAELGVAVAQSIKVNNMYSLYYIFANYNSPTYGQLTVGDSQQYKYPQNLSLTINDLYGIEGLNIDLGGDSPATPDLETGNYTINKVAVDNLGNIYMNTPSSVTLNAGANTNNINLEQIDYRQAIIQTSPKYFDKVSSKPNFVWYLYSLVPANEIDYFTITVTDRNDSIYWQVSGIPKNDVKAGPLYAIQYGQAGIGTTKVSATTLKQDQIYKWDVRGSHIPDPQTGFQNYIISMVADVNNIDTETINVFLSGLSSGISTDDFDTIVKKYTNFDELTSDDEYDVEDDINGGYSGSYNYGSYFIAETDISP